ncbi:MAG: 50S ribosomal protein L1 [Nitrososphaerales archaeon]
MELKEELTKIVKQSKEKAKKRNFKQSLELVMALNDIGLKKESLNINEVVKLPNPLSKSSRVCVIADRDLNLRAQKASADLILSSTDLERFATRKREARKLSKEYDFFLAEASLMPKIGKILGPFLGPRGRMPLPLTQSSPIETLIQNLKSSIRIRSRGQFTLACKIGDEDLSDEKIAENGLAVISALEKKLPFGRKNIKSLFIKETMGEPLKIKVEA